MGGGGTGERTVKLNAIYIHARTDVGFPKEGKLFFLIWGKVDVRLLGAGGSLYPMELLAQRSIEYMYMT